MSLTFMLIKNRYLLLLIVFDDGCKVHFLFLMGCLCLMISYKKPLEVE